MKISKITKLIVWFLLMSFVLEPFLLTERYAHAEDSVDTTESVNETEKDYIDDNEGINDSNYQTYWEEQGNQIFISKPEALKSLRYRLNDQFSEDKDYTPLEQKVTGSPVNQKLILNADDSLAIKSLYCLSNIMADLENDMPELMALLPENLKPESEQALYNIKFENPQKFQNLVAEAQKNWGEYNRNTILNDSATLQCITNFTINQIAEIREREPQYLEYVVDDAIDSLVIDIRVIHTLVYLVTPKDQGGAGHYRVKVERIRSGYTSKARQFSRESDLIRQMETANQDLEVYDNSSFGEATDLSGQTAAEIGMSRDVVVSDTGSLADAYVEDEDGTTYDAYLSEAKSQEDEVNISAHHDGKAVDISEIDDIRCTLIKKRRLGGSKKTKYSKQPIALAWQTQEGYDESGGNNQNDLNNLFKSIASDAVMDLVTGMGGDVTDFDGDLSQSSFPDLVKIVGQSLFSEVINSPNFNLSGYSIEDTMEKLGGMYFADFLGLPREIFIGRDMNSFDKLQTVIGQAAIEKRLDLPYGTFTGDNLNETLKNIGQRKLEFEMGLEVGDLNGFENSEVPVKVGYAVIENNLSLKKGTFRGNNYSEVKKNIGKYKADLLFMNSTYIDNALHLEHGTFDKLKNNQMIPLAFATLVGQTRLDDTAYGLKYFAANDGAYNLPEGTWDNALLGDVDSLRIIGINIISRSFTKNSDQRQAITSWVTNNIAKTNSEECYIPDKITQEITKNDETKTITISEEKALEIGMSQGDMFRLFGCSKSSGQAVFERIGSKILYYAIVNSALNPDEKYKIDLEDTNLEFNSSIPEVDFYLSRGQKINTLAARIKSNWQDVENNEDYDKITNSISSLINSIGDINHLKGKEDVKAVAQKISIETDYLKSEFISRETKNTDLTNKINGTIIDLNEIFRLTTEIIEGKAIANSESITLKQIPSETLATSSISSDGKSQETSINRSTIMLLLARKINPRDFFLNLGTEKAENELNLPRNSLGYYIQNVEKKGISNRDAFYQSIGQAKIEEEFGMPSYYFQGEVLQKDMPDFANNLDAIMDYLGFRSLSDQEQDSKKNALWDAKNDKEHPEKFNQYVLQAQENYNNEFANKVKNQGGHVLAEKTLSDVIKNIASNNLADGIRSADKDILFRMGMTGSFDALKGGSLAAWSINNKRAEEIDRKFWLEPGTTKSLYTGELDAPGSGQNILSENEKELLAGKMSISITAINRFLEALNGDISINELKKSGKGIFYNSSNPYVKAPEATDGQCPVLYNSQDGFMVADDIFADDAYVYVDNEGAHSFKNKYEAEKYAQEHSDKKIDFVTELAIGFERVNQHYLRDQLKNKILAFLSNSSENTLFSDEELSEIETTSGIPKSLLSKMLIKKNATLIDAPLQAYKNAVGQAEAKRVLGWKLFSGLGINIDPLTFNDGDLFELFTGDYQALYKIGGALIDQKLNLPRGTSASIVTAQSSGLRDCSIAKAGANFLGSLVGLNNVSLNGNIMHNIGQSKIEETLGLPTGSFRGGNIDELIKNVGSINIALAFKVPVADLIDDQTLSDFFAPEYVTKISKLTSRFKLEKINNYLNTSTVVSANLDATLSELNSNIDSRIKDIFNKDAAHWQDGYQIKYNQKEYASELNNFMSNLNYMDSIFGLSRGTTKALITEEAATIKNEDGNTIKNVRVTPDRYRNLVASRTLSNLAALKLGEILGLEGAQATSAINLVNNYRYLLENKRYGEFYSSLSTIFKVNLDEKAGFEEGTISYMLDNPTKSPQILIGQGIKELDERLNLKGDLSFYSIYQQYMVDDQRCEDIIKNDENNEISRNKEEKILNEALLNETDPEAQVRLDVISRERKQVQADYHTCKKESRSNFEAGSIFNVYDNINEFIEGKANNLASNISSKIKVKTGVYMPVEDVLQLTFEGDMRYFEAAVFAYSANKIIDSEGKEESVPYTMRVSYDDFKLALMGDTESEEYASQNALAYYTINGTTPTFDQSYVDYRYGDVCAGNGGLVVDGISCLNETEFLNQTANIDRNSNNLTDANKATIKNMYGDIDINSSEVKNKVDQISDQYMSDYQTCQEAQDNGGNYDSEKCAAAENYFEGAIKVDQEARRQSKKMFKEDLTFKTTDALLWKLDKNIYPGFAYAMMKGDADTKKFAMATYMRNGIMRGELFGVDIGIKVPRINEWLSAEKFFADPTNENALNNFYTTGGYTYVNNFVNNHAQDWFGFDLPEGMFGSLLVGISTGAWRKDQATGSAFNSNNEYVIRGSNGQAIDKLATLEQVTRNFAASKIFSWADKTFGWNVGDSYSIYQAYRTYQDAISLARELQTFTDFAELSEVATKAIESAGSIEGAREAAKVKIKQAAKAGIAIVVNIVFSKQIAKAEQSLGLVPGTGSMLVTMLITGLDPISVAIFIAFNLFGYYKVELQCSADGYYPGLESPPSSAKYDVTDLGVWNGMNGEVMKQKSIEAAQYKARRLIGDVINMQYTSRYQDIIPSQIMTGRQDDVDFWNDAVSISMCDKIGTVAIDGICGGDTQAGLWANPQTTAYTHIGF